MGTGISTPRLWRGGPRRSRDMRRAFRIVLMDSNWAVMDLFVLRARFTWMGSLLPLGSRPTWMMKLINALPLYFLLCMNIMLSGTPHIFLCHYFPVSLASEDLFISCAVFPGICLCFNVLFSPWIRPLCRWTVGRIDGHREQPGISANFFFGDKVSEFSNRFHYLISFRIRYLSSAGGLKAIQNVSFQH